MVSALQKVTLYRHTYIPLPYSQALYASLGAPYLLSEEDSVAAYEGRGQSQPSTHDAAMAALSSVLDRTQQVEVIHGQYRGRTRSCAQTPLYL